MKLIDNGKDSLKKSISILNSLGSDRSGLQYQYKLKDIVINLHHSIETIFKYMIKEKNEFLVYSNCEDIFKGKVIEKFKRTSSRIEIKTIQFLDAVHRVVVLYNIELKKEDYNKFIMLNSVRNSLTHFEIEFVDNEVEHLIALLLPVLLKIFKENIKSFDEWAGCNGIYSKVNNITKDMELWSVKYYYIFEKKWSDAKLMVRYL